MEERQPDKMLRPGESMKALAAAEPHVEETETREFREEVEGLDLDAKEAKLLKVVQARD